MDSRTRKLFSLPTRSTLGESKEERMEFWDSGQWTDMGSSLWVNKCLWHGSRRTEWAFIQRLKSDFLSLPPSQLESLWPLLLKILTAPQSGYWTNTTTGSGNLHIRRLGRQTFRKRKWKRENKLFALLSSHKKRKWMNQVFLFLHLPSSLTNSLLSRGI